MSSPTPLAGSVSVAYLQGLLDYLGRQGLDPAAFPVVDVSVEHFDGDAGHSAVSVVRGQLNA